MFENLSLGHLLVVVVIFVLLFGPKRIPEIAASLGGGIRTFKQSLQDGMQEGAQDGGAAPLARAVERTRDAGAELPDTGPKRLL